MKVYVGNLSWNTVEDTLREQFSEFGEVVSVKIVRDRESGRSRGFGFVEFSTEAAAEAAIEGMNGGMVDGRSLRVNVAHRREERHSHRNR
ncbi:MAG: RNA-binding protein [Chloroflexi bacterium]|nr:MAG: RNA-binding protein [Chloroflexota bacterium]